jgi:hypothetical protein
MFINISVIDFDPYLADSIKMAVVFSSYLLRHSTLVSSVWDSYKDYYSTDTSFSSLLDDVLEVVP